MLGNSGTGKTLLAQTIAKMLNLPFAILIPLIVKSVNKVSIKSKIP